MSEPSEVTALLLAWGNGERGAESALMAAVYDDLRRMDRRKLRAERADHSLAATALVHETYLRLIN